MKNSGPVAALAALLWLAAPIATHAADEPKPPAEQDKQDKQDKKEEKPIPEPKVFTSRHQIKIGGKAVDYEATAGTLLIKNDKDEPIALFGFTAGTGGAFARHVIDNFVLQLRTKLYEVF